jgi:FlaA1/EpsC-like NDP-sugar epimerase
MKAETVLVTGAGGSIGYALSQALVRVSSAHLILLDVSEQNLYRVDMKLGRIACRDRFTSVLGSISDEKLIDVLFEKHRIRHVFHTAAFKHVALLENNPLAALENNAIGTWKLASQAHRQRVSKFVMVSTDKAADPIGIMGATKRAAEIALLSFEDPEVQMIAVRLGNVWGSHGSVVPLFQEQIARGGPVTVTDPSASRYFFSLDESVDLVLSAAELGLRGIVFPQTGAPRNILELAKELITTAKIAAPEDFPIVFTGLRPGEKVAETFVSSNERIESTSSPRFFTVQSPIPPRDVLAKYWAELSKSVKLGEIAPSLAALRNIVTNFRPAK